MSGRYLVIETPDSFGGKDYTRVDVINFLNVDNISVGNTSAPSTAPAVAAPLTSSRSSMSASTASLHSEHALQQGPSGSTANAVPATRRLTAIGGSIANQRIAVTYTGSNSPSSRTVYFQSVNAAQLHKMLR